MNITHELQNHGSHWEIRRNLGNDYNQHVCFIDKTDDEQKIRLRELIDKSNQSQFGTWISVKDRLPEDNVPVLVSISTVYDEAVHTHCRIGCRDAGYWFTQQNPYSVNDITHWMPLPEPATKE